MFFHLCSFGTVLSQHFVLGQMTCDTKLSSFYECCHLIVLFWCVFCILCVITFYSILLALFPGSINKMTKLNSVINVVITRIFISHFFFHGLSGSLFLTFSFMDDLCFMFSSCCFRLCSLSFLKVQIDPFSE